MVFVDTSALHALLDADDENHARAGATWEELQAHDESLVTSSYVLCETSALIQRRLGVVAVRDLHQHLLPLIDVRWVDESVHMAATEALLAANRRSLSLVDCASFVLMRRHGIRRAFAFDRHFREQGFGPAGQRTG
jgi:predicted nucleic acid-binding protein